MFIIWRLRSRRAARRVIPWGNSFVPRPENFSPWGENRVAASQNFSPWGNSFFGGPTFPFPQGEKLRPGLRICFPPWGNALAGLRQTFADPKHLFPPRGNRKFTGNSDVVGSCLNESRSEPFFAKRGE